MIFNDRRIAKAGLLVAAILALCPPRASAQVNSTVVNANPPMTGTAGGGLVKAVEGALFSYAIMQTDKDTFVYENNLREEVEEIARSCRVQAVKLWSMTPGSALLTLRGTDGSGTFTYDLSGDAVVVAENTLFVDRWALTNVELDAGKDPDVRVQARVQVNLRPKGEPAAQPTRFGPGTAASLVTRQRINVVGLPEQKTSQSLKRPLLAALTAEQQKAVEQRKRVFVPVASLPPGLKPKVLEYIRAEVERIEDVRIDLDRIEQFDIVLLPPPSTALGVFGWGKNGVRVGF